MQGVAVANSLVASREVGSGESSVASLLLISLARKCKEYSFLPEAKRIVHFKLLINLKFEPVMCQDVIGLCDPIDSSAFLHTKNIFKKVVVNRHVSSRAAQKALQEAVSGSQG